MRRTFRFLFFLALKAMRMKGNTKRIRSDERRKSEIMDVITTYEVKTASPVNDSGKTLKDVLSGSSNRPIHAVNIRKEL